MGEYWKSLPRKFCDICKCWFADNKSSIEFHERGKKHIENAQKRIQDIQKRGLKAQKEQKKYDSDMERIEKAALAAYQKDLQNLGQTIAEDQAPPPQPVSNNNFSQIPPAKFASKPKVKSKPPQKTEPLPPEKVWYEAKSDEGYSYYWNSENSETQWEPPKEGYVSLEEQATSEATSQEAVKTESNVEEQAPNEEIQSSNNSQTSASLKEDKYSPPSFAIGPQPRQDPYGQWVTIEPPKVVDIDFQLPKKSEDVEIVTVAPKNEPKIKFKEKVIDCLPDTDPNEEVTFKKRRFGGSQKRNVRQRVDDD